MREAALFIVRRLLRDLPWLGGIGAAITAGFVVVPLVIGESTVDEALERSIGLSIGMVAVLPTIWLRFRVVRELGGRRAVLAYGMALLWMGMVVLVTLPILNALDA